MKKITLLTFLLLALITYGQTIYVSQASGSDLSGTTGTEGDPYKTLQQAFTINNANGTTFLLKEGSYHDSIVMIDKSNITIKALPGENVIFTGTKSISSATTDWVATPGKTNIFETVLTENIWQLFIDNQQQVMARWPNAQFHDDSVFSKATWAHGNDGAPDGTMKDSGKLKTAGFLASEIGTALVIANIGSFRTWVRPVMNSNPSLGVFNYTPINSGSYRDNHQDYFLEGSLAFLDTENEWFFNIDTKKLYVYGNPTGKMILGKNQSYFIRMSECSNITIEGVKFFATTIYGSDASNITVNNSLFSYPSCSKRMLRKTSYPLTTELKNGVGNISNFKFKQCLFEHTDGEALLLEGKDNIIEDCYFHHIDYSCGSVRYLQSSIVNRGTNCTFKNNTVFTTGASETLSIGDGPKISYNDISNTGLLQNDGSLIQFTRNAPPNSEVHHNWLHDSRKSGMRYDAPGDAPELAGTKGLVHHNVIWNTGKALMIKGDEHKIYNNTCYNSSSVSITILAEAGANLLTKTINNAAGQISGHRGNPTTIPGTSDHNYYSTTSTAYRIKDLLTDPDNFDFTPKVTSVQLIDQAVAIPGITDVSIPGSPATTTPAIGAYNIGDNWVAGTTWTPDFYPWGVSNIPNVFIEKKSSAKEGQGIEFKLKLSYTNTTATMVTIHLSDLTAESDDYTSDSFQVTIPANKLSVSFVVPTTDDLLNETDETFSVEIASVDTANANNVSGTVNGIILNNDIPSPSDRNGFVLDPSFELSPAFDKWTYTGVNGSVTLSNDLAVANSGSNSAVVEVNTTGGQGSVKLVGTPYSFAGNGLDRIYVTVSLRMKVETVTAGKRIKMLIRNSEPGAGTGARSAQFSGLTTDWKEFTYTTNFNADENYQLYLDMQFGEYPGKIFIDHITATVSGGAALSGGDTVSNVILDNAQVIEGGDISIPVSIDHVADEAIVLTLETSNHTTDDSDYIASDLHITIPAGEKTVNAVFSTTDDNAYEKDEIFTVAVKSVDAGEVGTSSDTAKAMIINDDQIGDNNIMIETVVGNNPENSNWILKDTASPFAIVASGSYSARVANTVQTLYIQINEWCYDLIFNKTILSGAIEIKNTISKELLVPHSTTNTSSYDSKRDVTRFCVNTITSVNKSLNTKSAIELNSSLAFNVYPNPTISAVTISSLESKIYAVEVYNNIGSKVLNIKNINKNRENIQLDGFGAGLYVFKILLNDNSIKTMRIVKK